MIKVLGVDRNTILQGKKELLQASEYEQIPLDKQWMPGGGRKKLQNILSLNNC